MAFQLPPTCPLLVGREGEVALFERLLLDGRRGSSSMVVILGEAGAGKSRLARVVAESARAQGYDLLTGDCTERDRDFPFGLFIDVLRQRLLQPGTDPRALFGADGEWLRELLPELTRFYQPPPGAQTLTPEQRKRQHFEALAAVLAHRAAAQPLLIVLEDMHWADPTSLELLELLPRRLARLPVVLLVTAREDDVNARLMQVLRTLQRARALVEVHLQPLSTRDVERMLEAMLSPHPAAAATQLVIDRAGGNPFFVEELLAPISAGDEGWLAGDVPVPQSVRASVLQRLAALPTATQEVVQLLAVAGARVERRLLLRASDLDADALDEAVDLLVERGLLDASSRQRRALAFRHALTRDAILTGMPLLQRRPLHARVAAALDAHRTAERPEAANAADLGYHFHAAGDWAQALTHARAAGDTAWHLHATFEALGHYRRAVDAAERLESAAAGWLHLRCGEALERLGHFDSARAHLDDALQSARANADPALEQRALYAAAGLYTSRDYAQAQTLAEAAVERARALGDRQREGLALNRLGNVLTNLERFSEGRALHEQAMALFSDIDDQWGIADSTDLLGSTDYLRGDVIAARTHLAQAADRFAALNALDRVASARTMAGLYLAVLDGPCATDAEPAAYLEDAQRGLDLCHAINWRAGEIFALVALGCAQLGAGEHDPAIWNLWGARNIAKEIDHPQWLVITQLSLGLYFADLEDDARALVEFMDGLALARRHGFAQWAARLQCWVARCHMRLGNLPLADTLLQPLLPDGLPDSIRERRALTMWAELALQRGDIASAREAVERLLAAAGDPPPAGTLLLHGHVLLAAGNRQDAAAVFSQAQAVASAVGPRGVLWRAAAARSEIDGDSDAGQVARAEVAAIADALPEDWRAAFVAAPAVRRWVSPRRVVYAPAEGLLDRLTRREREVAALVAQGLTNKQIASHLSLAEKTIEMHVSNCLSKLEFGSRTSLAAWAVTQDLPAPPSTQLPG